MEQLHELKFGPVTVHWLSPPEIKTPIGVAYWKLNARKFAFVTHAIVVFKIGEGQTVTVGKGYVFDGASIPQVLWWIPGFSPLGKHIWAALCHDWMCDHPKETNRVVADAIFYTILENTGVGRIRAAAMYAGVFAYAVWKRLRKGRRQAAGKPKVPRSDLPK